VTNQWDRFEETSSRHIRNLGGEQVIEVRQPTETYVAGDGFEISYPGAADATLDADLAPPAETADTADEGGTTTTGDLTVYVDSATDVIFREAGDEEVGPTRITLRDSGDVFAVDTVVDQRDGLLEIRCTLVTRGT